MKFAHAKIAHAELLIPKLKKPLRIGAAFIYSIAIKIINYFLKHTLKYQSRIVEYSLEASEFKWEIGP